MVPTIGIKSIGKCLLVGGKYSNENIRNIRNMNWSTIVIKRAYEKIQEHIVIRKYEFIN